MEKKKEHPAVAKALAMMAKNRKERTKGVYSGDKPKVSVDQIMKEYKDKKDAVKKGEEWLYNKAKEELAAENLKEQIKADAAKSAKPTQMNQQDAEMKANMDAANSDYKKDQFELDPEIMNMAKALSKKKAK